jgi:hypothetical protein
MKLSMALTMSQKVHEMQRKIKDKEFVIEKEGEIKVDWKSILKKSSIDMYGKYEKTDKLLDYNPIPAEHVQKKIDYFFKPYNKRDNFLNKKIKY